MTIIHLIIHSMSGTIIGLKTYMIPMKMRMRIVRVRHLYTNIVQINGQYVNLDKQKGGVS